MHSIKPYDYSKPVVVEVNESRFKRVSERINAFLSGPFFGEGDGDLGAFTWGLTGIIFGVPTLLVSGLGIHYTQCKMLSSNLSALAQGKLRRRNFQTGKFIPLANTAANRLRITKETQSFKILVVIFSLFALTLFLVTPVASGIYASCNVFSLAVSKGKYKEVKRLIKMGFKPTQKNIDSAVRNKHYGIAILLFDNFSGTSTTNRADLVEKYENQLKELREERRKKTVAYFNKFNPENMSDDERKEIELLREGRYEEFNIHRLKSQEAKNVAREILKQQEDSE